MENPKLKHEDHQSRNSPTNSPDFQFWMVRNPSSFPQPDLATADELFVNGVLLPLHLRDTEPPIPDPPVQLADSALTRESTTSGSFTSSKRWRDLFSKKADTTSTDKKDKEIEQKEKKKKKKLERKSQRKTSSGSAELNINIWPFSRSRSAGNNATRPRIFAPATRKVSSAPCSRSNSAGESKSRKWPTSSPGRPGVHLGRSSPVWQVRRGLVSSGSKMSEPVPVVRKEVSDGARSKIPAESTAVHGGPKVVKMNVPMCSDCRHLKDGRSSGGHIFNLRSLFSRKVY